MKNKYINKLEYDKILKHLEKNAITFLGKNLALNLLPSFSKIKVENLLSETTEAVNCLVKYGNCPITNINDISNSVKTLQSNSSLSIKSLLEVAHVLKLSKDIKNYFFNDNNTEAENIYPVLNNLISNLYFAENIYNKITASIIDENTIADTASSELHSIRRKQYSIEENIRNELNNFLHSSSYSKYIQDAVITIRNNRFVVPIKEEYRGMVKGFIHDTSASGSTVFIEPISVFELNNESTHLKTLEQIEIEKILLNLSALLYDITNELLYNYNTIGQLDFIFAKAKYSIESQCTRPTINENKYINLINAKHPLIDANTAVPISINIGKDFSTLVITGPNTGGKTVTLKTIGLLCLMAYSGLYIPAKEGSSLYVFDQIFADIGDEQSIQESLSTFSAHMSNIIEITKLSSKNSLVLLDELGSGTDPIEGETLAISILENFYKNNTLTVATTHYPGIKNYALVNNGFQNASCEFDIENLKPTYKLLIGIPGKSNAFAISKKLGLSQNILDRANLLLTSTDIDIETLMKNIYDDKIKIEKEKQNIEKNSNQIELLRKNIQKQNADLEAKKMSIIEKARIEARNLLLEAKEEINKAIALSNSSTNSKDLNKARNELNDKIKSTVEIKRDNFSTSVLKPQDIKIGTQVFINNLGQVGTILSLPNKSNELQVQIGNLKTNISLKNLSLVNIKTKTSSTNKQKSITTFSTSKAKTVSSEINVIGLNVEEAIFIIDKYLDDCALAKLPEIRIVHGKGTGTLRNGIHTFLKKHNHVSNFRLGTYGEGEMGVTVVTLK